MLVYYIYNAFPPFLAVRQSTWNWRRMTSFVSLLPRKRSSVPVRFHRLNCSSVVAVVAEIVETTIFLLAREVENKIYKGGIVLISECYLSKMSSHVILSYPPCDNTTSYSYNARRGQLPRTRIGIVRRTRARHAACAEGLHFSAFHYIVSPKNGLCIRYCMLLNICVIFFL